MQQSENCKRGATRQTLDCCQWQGMKELCLRGIYWLIQQCLVSVVLLLSVNGETDKAHSAIPEWRQNAYYMSFWRHLSKVRNSVCGYISHVLSSCQNSSSLPRYAMFIATADENVTVTHFDYSWYQSKLPAWVSGTESRSRQARNAIHKHRAMQTTGHRLESLTEKHIFWCLSKGF